MKAMTAGSAAQLKSRLKRLGLSDTAIAAAWPRWWTDDADWSVSAQAELRFSVARQLGLDPRSLFDDQSQPRFLWREEARFKHLSGEGEVERAGITSFGRAVASILVTATPPPAADFTDTSARDLRLQILKPGRPYVELLDLLSVCWAAGVPVVHLRVFPWRRKRMAAMTARVGERSSILLGKDSMYPAQIAFYLGHELGHVALAHVAADRQIVDFEERGDATRSDDEEEHAADAFALELLTGEPRPTVLAENAVDPSASELARVAMRSAAELQIEPGMLVQCFGYSTGNWQTATAALKYVYASPRPVWADVNAVARSQLALEDVPQDAVDFLNAVLGEPDG